MPSTCQQVQGGKGDCETLGQGCQPREQWASHVCTQAPPSCQNMLSKICGPCLKAEHRT